ncbi:MAG: Transcriptional regulator, ArsR family [Parcubacteria group bacterium GW2011_GWA1_59_11]|nr:MAG: Transcriptional regulator, ArsR family [Parcubacteria group bacterium GW2011_GWA1_59_11]
MLSQLQINRIRKTIEREDERLPIVFGALSDARRYRIFRLLLEHRDLCVTEIAKIFGISVPAASQQLKILEMTGLIRRERMGQSICYEIKIADPMIRSLIRTMDDKKGRTQTKTEP